MGARLFRTSTFCVLCSAPPRSNLSTNSGFYPLGAHPSILKDGQPGLGGWQARRGKGMNSILKHHRWFAWMACLAALLLLASPVVRAQAQENIANLPAVDDNITADDSHDPPSRVARVSIVEGSVSLQPGGTGDWGNAIKNRPVTIGDKLWVDKDSRAELQAGQASIHLGPMTALSFLNLDQNIVQMRLPEGKVNFRVREIRQGETYEIDTPNMAFTVKEAGAFRVDVNENGDFTGVTVIRGAGEIAASGQVTPVSAGQHVDVTGADGSVKFSTGSAPALDNLDQWAQQRDIGEDNSVSSKYVNRDVVGYSDLDDYGNWKEEPEYGNVWVPNNTPADWAPYSNGYWNWVAPWGWTWVDYAPWGFAPYHYGRWNWFGSYWGWCPGPIAAYPYYGPAFVGFLGGGFGFGFGFGWGWGGGYGWFPLGWGEPYHPWYHCGYTYWNNVNIHNTYIHNFHINNPRAYHGFNYANAHNVRAVTTASHNDFVNGHSINRGSQHLTEANLRNAQVTNRIAASPTRSSYFGSAAQHGRVATPSSGIQNRSVVARTSPAPGASHMPVRTMNSATLRPVSANSSMVAARPSQNMQPGVSANRMSQLSANRPPYATQPGGRPGMSTVPNSNTARPNGNGAFNNSNRPNGSTRSWNAQGNVTDSGHAPQGFGANRPNNSVAQPRNDRPPYAGSSVGAPQQHNSVNRPPASYNGGRSYNPQTYNGGRSYNSQPYNGGRSYTPPSNGNRSYTPPRGGNYSAPRSYSPAPHYSAPAPHYSAPRSSAPSGGGFHGGSGGGGGHVGGGGGGGGSHGGGGRH